MELDLQVTRRQKAFCEAGALEVLFGGAAGGGKSMGQLIDALLYALKYPGSKQLLLRRTFPDLERSLIQDHLKFYPLRGGLYAYNSTAHRGRFKNGSVIEFGYLATEMDKYQYQGAEYDTIRFDELTQFTEEMYLYLMSRLRGVNAYPKQIKSSTNPGGIGHTWVKARFVDIGPPDTVHRLADGRGNESTRLFLPSKVTDNKLLMRDDPQYIKRLEQLPEKERKALLLGEWDLFDGQFFAEFRRGLHTCAPFAVPPEWRRYVTLDYGLDMLAAYWVAVAPDGRAWVYREVYEGRDNGMGAEGKGHIVSAAARRLLEMTPPGEEIYAWLAPPDLWNRNRDTGRSTADIFAEHGILLEKTSNDRVAGWRAVREWLALSRDEQGGGDSRTGRFAEQTGGLEPPEAAAEDAQDGQTPGLRTEGPEAAQGAGLGVSNAAAQGWGSRNRAGRFAEQTGGMEPPEAPGLTIFETCPNLIRTLPAVQFDSRRPEDVASDPHELTHAPDALRGFCVYWTAPAAAQEVRVRTILDEFHLQPAGDPLGRGEEIHVI